MDNVATLPADDRSDLFRAAAEQRGVTVQIIEKDFWVCWVLRHLYTLDDLPAEICFKGGTTLSKVFGVIERMSEDIDLVIDRTGLGFTGDRDPSASGISNKARDRLIDDLKAEAGSFVGGSLFDALRHRFEDTLGGPKGWSIEADVSNLDNTHILFRYPTQESPAAYLRPMVLLELGARGDTWPSVTGTVTPYAADAFPDQFREPEAQIRAITAERTFWEKATCLHAIAHQPAEKTAKAQPTRHYYDIYLLSRHEFGKRAIADTELLADVVAHKQMFFRQGSARYDLAVPGTLRLVPDEDTVRVLRADYQRMAEEMVFGEAPGFDEVLAGLREIEQSVNGL
jgi:hypothetical protein